MIERLDILKEYSSEKQKYGLRKQRPKHRPKHRHHHTITFYLSLFFCVSTSERLAMAKSTVHDMVHLRGLLNVEMVNHFGLAHRVKVHLQRSGVVCCQPAIPYIVAPDRRPAML
jgi:hypothetical protein